MGIPYSKQIHSAFDQVTPLVASAYEVLQTTKNIAILLAFIQVYTAGLLGLVLLALIGLLFSLNPDLEAERRAIVTPTMRWLAGWILDGEARRRSVIGAFSLFLAVVAFSAWVWLNYVKVVEEEAGDAEGAEGDGDGKDLQAIKDGNSKQ